MAGLHGGPASDLHRDIQKKSLPPLLVRNFRLLEENVDIDAKGPTVRIMQWNMLAQGNQGHGFLVTMWISISVFVSFRRKNIKHFCNKVIFTKTVLIPSRNITQSNAKAPLNKQTRHIWPYFQDNWGFKNLFKTIIQMI